MQIIGCSRHALTPHTANSRTHNASQVAQIAASIERFGFTVPIVIDEGGTVLAGHGRLAAAELLGPDTVPCVKIEGLTDEAKRAYLIADNKIASNASWDEDLLKIELVGLKDAGFDMGLPHRGSREMSVTVLDIGLLGIDGFGAVCRLREEEQHPRCCC